MSCKPVKVLSVCTSDSLGGAARAAYRIHLAVRDLGVDSRMFVKYKGADDPTVLTVDDFIPHNALYRGFDWGRNKIRNIRQHCQWGKYSARSGYFMSDLRSTDLGRALQRIDYDILHLHWVNMRFLPLEELPVDKPIVWTLHDSWPFCGICHVPFDCHNYEQGCGCCPGLDSDRNDDLSQKVWKEKKRIYGKREIHIVTPSRWMAECAGKSALFGDRDIHVIPNCIDTVLFSPGDRSKACGHLHLDARKRHILFGSMSATKDPNKGFRYLADALSRIPQEERDSVDLVMLGDDKLPDNLINGLPVLSLGVLRTEADMVAAYRAADLTVVPSLSENLSCTIMESLSCGTPAVAFDIGGNGDMIRHGANGYLAREKDTEDLAEGILWTLRQDYGVLSSNARQTVLERFTSRRIGEEYQNLYSMLYQ